MRFALKQAPEARTSQLVICEQRRRQVWEAGRQQPGLWYSSAERVAAEV